MIKDFFSLAQKINKRGSYTHLINTHVVNNVQNIPKPENANGTSAQGVNQSIISGVNLSQPNL